MKSILLAKSAICMGLFLLAGQANAQIGIHAGWLMQPHSSKSDNIQFAPSYGFYAGIDGDLYLDDLFVLTPGVRFSLTASNDLVMMDLPNSYDYYYFEATEEMFLSVPIKARYMLDFSEDFMVYPFADATVEYSLRAKETIEDRNLYELAGFKKWDVKAGGGLGVQLFGFLKLECGYDFGFLNRSSALPFRTNQLYAGITFNFGEGSGGGSYAPYYGASSYGGYGGYVSPPSLGASPAPVPNYGSTSPSSNDPYVSYQPFLGPGSSSLPQTREGLSSYQTMHTHFSEDGVDARVIRKDFLTDGTTAVAIRITNNSGYDIVSCKVDAIFMNSSFDLAETLSDSWTSEIESGSSGVIIVDFDPSSGFNFFAIENVYVTLSSGDTIHLGVALPM